MMPTDIQVGRMYEDGRGRCRVVEGIQVDEVSFVWYHYPLGCHTYHTRLEAFARWAMQERQDE